MILCLCRGVPETAVGAIIADGASSLDDITSACEAGADCGACHEHMLGMLAGRGACHELTAAG